MTALEYMKKQIVKHKINLDHHPYAPQEQIDNIRAKIGYYEEAVKALERTAEHG